jgi:hypothetical protein
MYYAMIIFRDTLEADGVASVPICLRVRVPRDIPVTTGDPAYTTIRTPVKPKGKFEEAWVTKTIPPSQIEVYWQDKWQPIKDVGLGGNWEEMQVRQHEWSDEELEWAKEQGKEPESMFFYEDWDGDDMGQTVAEVEENVKAWATPKTAARNSLLNHLKGGVRA